MMNYSQVNGRQILLDTAVLVYWSKYPLFFTPMVKELQKNKASAVISQAVLFEFLRGAKSKKEYGELNDFLNNILGKNVRASRLNLGKEIFDRASAISLLYNWKLRNNKSSLVDCVLAAELRNHNFEKEKLFLATSNHKDFPSLIFDRIGIESVDVKEEIITVGFYSFNKLKYKNWQKNTARCNLKLNIQIQINRAVI